MTSEELKAFYRGRTEFDPVAYMADVRANPQNYVTVESVKDTVMQLRSIRSAKTLGELKISFTVPAWAARDAKDDDLLKLLTDAKDARKMELAE